MTSHTNHLWRRLYRVFARYRTAAAILRDTMYMTSRSSIRMVEEEATTEESRNIPVLLFRNHMEVMVSHFHLTVRDSTSNHNTIGLIHHDDVADPITIRSIPDTPESPLHSFTIKCLSQRDSPGIKYNDNHQPKSITTSKH